MSTDDTPAVDRESLFSAMTTMCKVLGMDQVTAESTAVEHIGMWFNEGILRDVREVQHEHGERIADTAAPCPTCGPGYRYGDDGCRHRPASVDDLRTRLARAFEVAALRDPSAELAAFEAAVRHETWAEGYERAKRDHCDYYPSSDACTEDSPNPYGRSPSPAPEVKP